MDKLIGKRFTVPQTKSQKLKSKWGELQLKKRIEKRERRRQARRDSSHYKFSSSKTQK